MNDRTCENCLNAYNSPFSPSVICWNKEFEAQFNDIDVTVRHGESCGSFQQRRKDQKPLRFNQAVELSFDF